MSESVGAHALAALRAIALCPRGMQITAQQDAMWMLIELGYVIERQARWEGALQNEIGRFITPAGRELLAVLGSRDHG
ncbi:hypothetical protein FV232_27365 [Methylobacterium sp. WL30]|uniref:hypothetical protein n=1 Tax=unclassified Methylobacterium TaxID=2615210 RepID=UPI0011CA0BCD|nr:MULTISPECIES: hypothetical protein [unclassified Methylobacterium]TXN26045.1 hypothetical protein FV225_23920 [Methylobacterium sp. WL93]TXN44864.1 hypothetical protein FV227_26090 [Methylobacterium sp. WL119]TXN61255.1 hypothetical protein FV232_27365 [Methylobacterium sp. WL30]